MYIYDTCIKYHTVQHFLNEYRKEKGTDSACIRIEIEQQGDSTSSQHSELQTELPMQTAADY